MAVERKYAEQPLQYVDTQEKLDRIEKIAADEQISKAQVMRELTDMSLARREAISAKRVGRG